MFDEMYMSAKKENKKRLVKGIVSNLGISILASIVPITILAGVNSLDGTFPKSKAKVTLWDAKTTNVLLNIMVNGGRI